MNRESVFSSGDVDYLSKLSRVDLLDGDHARFSGQLSEIITYLDTLQQLDTEGIDPTFLTAPLSNVLRRDEVCPSLSLEDVLSNAPGREDFYFTMPRILEREENIDL